MSNQNEQPSSPALSLPQRRWSDRRDRRNLPGQPIYRHWQLHDSYPGFPGSRGFGPSLSLQYSTGNGNGLFGLGWELSIPRITRKTEKGLPKYNDKDVFLLSGAEDLVLRFRAGTTTPDTLPRGSFTVHRYRPRTEGLFPESRSGLTLSEMLIGEQPQRTISPAFTGVHRKRESSILRTRVAYTSGCSRDI